ncbi:hypothetical protein NL676_024857 [Syzygium grande]|nr:hypothetical protein NL676_024857 [Syzygium grande]
MDVSRKYDMSYDVSITRWRGGYHSVLLMLVPLPPYPQRFKNKFAMDCDIEAALDNGFDIDPFPLKC